jgi:hypothetical protein
MDVSPLTLSGHPLDKYASPREQPRMILMFESEDAEWSRRVKVICDVEREAVEFCYRSQLRDTEILVGLCKDEEI